MRLQPSLVGHVEALLADILTFRSAADALTSRYFHAHPQLGQRDRAIVAEATFAVLRHKLEFAQFAQSGVGSLERRLALLGLAYECGMDEVRERVSPSEAEWLGRIALVDRRSLPFEARCNLPDWLLARLRVTHSDAEIERLANALNRSAPLDVRANSLKTTRDKVHAQLASLGIEARATPYAPDGLRLAGKPALQNSAPFKEGTIEVQDEGSQLLAYLVGPRRGELVVDFCAGAGGKTLALGALMRSTGRLYAMDVSAQRLTRLKPRLARSGLSNVHPQALDSERDSRLKRLAQKADRVLVDAPCSGLGTLRRNPDLKWRQTEASVGELAAKQRAILDAAARLVKPGGRLVYATCSLLDEENGAVVEAFKAAHDEFVEVHVGQLLKEAGIALDTGPRLALWPHLHATDGFFAAVLQRTGPAALEGAASGDGQP